MIVSEHAESSRALLLALAMEKRTKEGKVLWEGHPLPKDWMRRMAFIPSAHHKIKHRLTVRERLLKASKLRRLELSEAERMAEIERILAVTELVPPDRREFQLTLLQSKLIALAVELTANPHILFIMDPFEKNDRVDDIIYYGRVLRRVAEEFHTPILLQLEHSRFLSDLPADTLTLCVEGQEIYQGDYCKLLLGISENLGYSSVQSVALLGRLLSPYPQSNSQFLIEKQQLMEVLPQTSSYQPHRWPTHTCVSPPNSKSTSAPVNFGILTEAQLSEDVRHWRHWTCIILSYAFIYLLVSFLYFQLPLNQDGLYDRQGLFYFVSFNLLILNGLPQLIKFQVEMAQIEHEHRLRLVNAMSFILSQFITNLLLPLLLILIFGTALYYISGLRTDGFQYLVVFLADLLLLASASVALGMLVASSFTHVEFSQLAMPFLAAIFFVYGNLSYAPNPTWILRWLQYLTPLYYSFQCLLQNELANTRFAEGGIDLNQFLNERGLDQMPIAACLGALFGFTLIYLILACIVVEFRNKRYYP